MFRHNSLFNPLAEAKAGSKNTIVVVLLLVLGKLTSGARLMGRLLHGHNALLSLGKDVRRFFVGGNWL